MEQFLVDNEKIMTAFGIFLAIPVCWFLFMVVTCILELVKKNPKIVVKLFIYFALWVVLYLFSCRILDTFFGGPPSWYRPVFILMGLQPFFTKSRRMKKEKEKEEGQDMKKGDAEENGDKSV